MRIVVVLKDSVIGETNQLHSAAVSGACLFSIILLEM